MPPVPQNTSISAALPAYVRALAEKDPAANLVVCYGEEEYLHRQVLRAVQKQAAENKYLFRWGMFAELAPSAQALCQAPSLFATRQITFFQQCQTQQAGLQKLLQEFPPLSQVHQPCIFSYVKDKLPAAILKACQKAGAWIMHGAPLSPMALSEFAAKKAHDQGIPLTSAALSQLLQRTGNSLATLDHALEQLAVLDLPTPITPAQVAKYIASTREEPFFLLEQLLLQSKFAQAQLFLQAQLAKGESAVLLNSLLSKHCRTALLCKSLQKKSQPLPTSTLRMPPFVLQSYNRYVQHKPMWILTKAFLLTQETDLALKSTRLPHDLLLTRIVDTLQQTGDVPA